MLLADPVFLVLDTTEPGGAGEIVRLRAERLEAVAPSAASAPSPVGVALPAELAPAPVVPAQSGEAKSKGRRKKAAASGAASEGLPALPPGLAARSLTRLVQPRSRLTLAQQRMLDVTNRELERAPDLDAALEDLLGFSAGAGAWVVAEGPAARAALQRAASEAGLVRGLGFAVLGVDELGAAVHPTICRQGVEDLAAHYGLPARRGPDLLRELWTRLETDLLRLPLPLLAEMNWLLNPTQHPLKTVLHAAEKHAVETQFAAAFTAEKLQFSDLFPDFSEVLKSLPARDEEDEDAGAPDALAPEVPVTAADTHALLGPGGPLAKAMPGYEHRREQLELAGRVAEALTAGHHLLAEAGTGVGKSLAYLVPAVLFAQRAGRPVMLSTHTKNLQAQLYFKDIPLLREALGLEFKAALLKGRPNYLCPHKLVYTLQEAAHELEEGERAALLPVLTWAVQTQSGDAAELAAFAPEQNLDLWDRLHTVGEDCLGRQCARFRNCFVYRARALARSADLVVLNHALVFAELNLENVLPPYQEIVFDEAHTLEDVATEHLACEVTPRRVTRILHRLFRAPPGSTAGKGALPGFLFQLEQAKRDFPAALHRQIQEHALTAVQAVGPAEAATEAYFESLRGWFQKGRSGPEDDTPVAPYVPRERGRGGPGPAEANGLPGDPFGAPTPRAAARSGRRASEDCRRFAAKDLRPDDAETFRSAKEGIISGLGRLRQALGSVVEDFREVTKRNMPRARELHRELAAQEGFLQELIEDLEFVMKGDEPNHVYWMERLGRRALRVVAAPLDLSGVLHDQLYARKRSIILTSATLSLRDAAADPGAGLAPLRGLRVAATAQRMAGPVRGDFTPPEATADEYAQTDEPAGGVPRPQLPAVHPKAFEFLKQRLGLALCEAGKLEEALEGSPFDYPRQCRLYVPVCLPDPSARGSAPGPYGGSGRGGEGARDFNTELTALLAQLAIASRGRALALFTSHESLRFAAATLRRTLAAEGIEVLAQGLDGSREALLARLRAGGSVLLLGTSSFWEGVDVPGEALSLLVIAKLPFAVFTDPLVEGRCELLEAQGKDPFLHFSVPNAILKLRQGFGRLIRSKTDRGVVVLCDKRVVTKRYGPAFLRALPVPARQASDAARLAEEVREFLDGPAQTTQNK